MLLDVTYVSVWNGGFEIPTPAKLNTETLEVTDIVGSDVDVDQDGDSLEHLDSQHILWGRYSIDVYDDSEGTYTADPDPDVHEMLLALVDPGPAPFGGNPVAYIPLPDGYEGVRPMKILHSLSHLVQLDERPIQKYEKGTTFYYEFMNAVVFVYAEIKPIGSELKHHAPQITRMLTISTEHLTTESEDFLQDEQRAVLSVYPKNEFGWFIYLNYDTIEEDILHIPDNLKEVLRYAQQQHVGILCLDHDASIIPELPIYDT